MNPRKRRLEMSVESTSKRQKENTDRKVPIYKDLKLNQRQHIIVMPQYQSVLKHKKILVLKAIIATGNKPKIFDILAHDKNREKIQYLELDKLYIFHNILVIWHTNSKRKMARIDRFAGAIKMIKSTQLSIYGQNMNMFKLDFREDQVITNYLSENIQYLNAAGFIVSIPEQQKQYDEQKDSLYTFWMKNKENCKILVNYWGKEAPKNIEKGKVVVFTSLTPNNYIGIKSLTVNGPWYVVAWQWNFNGEEINISSKPYESAQS